MSRWLRFSLRTLLLAVLLIASAATLWWNWGPWERAFVIRPDRMSSFTWSDKYLGVSTEARIDPSRRVIFYDLTTGRECLQDLAARAPQACIFSDSCRYAVGYTPTNPPRAFLYDTETKAFSDLPHIEPAGWGTDYDPQEYHFLEKENLLLNSRMKDTRFHLPDLTQRKLTNEEKAKPGFQSNERWRVSRDGTNAIVYTTDSEVPVAKCNLPPDTRWLQLHHDLMSAHAESEVAFYSLKSGKLIHRFKDLGGEHRVHVLPSGTHAVLYDLKPGHRAIWQLHPEPKEVLSFNAKEKKSYLNFVGERVALHSPLTLFSPATGKPIWTAGGSGGFFSPDGRYVCQQIDGETYILDGATGRQLFHMSKLRWSNEIPNNPFYVTFKKDSDSFLTSRHSNPDQAPNFLESAALWRLRRPHVWYGPAWLPEFWLTLLLAGALLWSLHRDRRIHRPA